MKLSRQQRRELRLRHKLAEKSLLRAVALRRLQSPMIILENALAELGVTPAHIPDFAKLLLSQSDETRSK